MKNKENKTNTINHPKKDINPIDVSISIHINNLFNTYGKEKVLNTIEELFIKNSPNKEKKAV